jgi:hypothetical protein
MCSLNTERAIPHSENAGHWPCGKPTQLERKYENKYSRNYV